MRSITPVDELRHDAARRRPSTSCATTRADELVHDARPIDARYPRFFDCVERT